MTCREICQFLDDYLDGEVAPHVRAAFDAHVGVCSDCQHYIDGYRKTLAAARALIEPEDEVDAMPEQLVQAILRAAGQRPRTS